MTVTPSWQLSAAGLGTLRQIVSLLAQVRNLSGPLNTAAGLRDALGLLAQLAQAAGVDAAWVARITQALNDPGVFNIVLALVQYLTGGASTEQADGGIHATDVHGAAVTVSAASLADWLPIVVQLVSLWNLIRGQQ
ncbi:MAG: hypothetical protein JSS27_02455 [Planctomycetes bacterium]|nr:hypothetical protein [Planctomycetota bacterium]